MKTRLFNAKILTDASAEIFDGEIVTTNDQICYVGKDKFKGKCDKEIDCLNNLVMAGFVNCHAHSPMVLLRGIGANKNLNDWLFDVNNYEKKLTAEDVYYGTLLAVTEYLKSGITTVNENYFFQDIMVKAFEQMGIRAVVGLSLDYSINKKMSKDVFEKFAKKMLKNKSELTSFNFYVHSLYANTEADYMTSIKLAKEYNTFVNTHMSETLNEVGIVSKNYDDKTPTKLLEEYGFFDVKSLVAHSVHVFDEDIKILKDKNSSVAINISSNLKLGSGIPPVYALYKRGVNVCLGTDGAASNDRLDMFREMYLTSVVQKGYLKDSSALNASDIIKFATENGAKALNLTNVGVLKKGYKADLILLNLKNNLNLIEIKNSIVNDMGTENVLLTMINGKVLYENGKVLSQISVDEIVEKCKKISQKLFN